jgi:hypothetical protein
MYPMAGRTRRSRSGSPPREKPEPEPIREREFALRIKPRKTPMPVKHHYEPDCPRKKLTIVVKEVLSKAPDISLADMKEELKEMGYPISELTLGTLRRDFYETIRIAEKAGYIRLLR